MKTFKVVLWLGLLACASATSIAQNPDDENRQESQTTKEEKRLREIIESVRKAETPYHNLETVIRVTRHQGDRPDGAEANVPLEEDLRHTIQQGDLFWFHSEQVQTLLSGEQFKTEQLAAFDGKTTRSIDYGNCVNVHAGRHEPVRLLPPHTWVMLPLEVNFPLSVYLQGTAAMAKHPKVRRFPRQYGMVFEFSKVETAFVWEEKVDGMECVKLRVQRWHRDDGPPEVQFLWLATEHNYLCVKAQVHHAGQQGEQPGVESRALELREIAPDLWLPFQVEVNYFFPAVQGVPERAVHSTISLAVEKAVPEPNYPPEHFRAVEVPDELPLFKIDRQGYLENGPLRPAQTKLPDQRELVRVVAAVREQERRFEQFDATLRATYRKHDTNIFDASETVAYENDERTVALPNKLYASQRETSHSAGQGDSAFTRVAAWDGHWTRSLEWRSQPNDPGLKFSGASLRKGGPAGLNAFRPHTALFDDSRERGRPLSEYLTSEWYDRHNRYLQKIEYWGEDVVDGLKCEKLRVCLPHGEQAEPALFFFLWLAKDRNYLPVRTEWYERRWSARLPTGITTVHEWREITGGLWLPVHVVKLVNQMGREGLCEGRFLINWRLDRHVENFSLRPEVTDDLFELSVPGATAVNVEDERGEWIGQIHQAEPGLPTVNDEKWLVMAASARADDQERERRQAALDALIGKPAPEFADATWLNTPALNTKSLAGKVVLLDFWAEWSVSCHQELKKLGEVDTSLAEAGIVVIGVHPTGGRREDIERAAKEFGLDFPIYIDATPSDGKHVWGEFFEQCAVRELPHALVVDQQGRIVAHGRLDAMIAKAQQLLEK